MALQWQLVSEPSLREKPDIATNHFCSSESPYFFQKKKSLCAPMVYGGVAHSTTKLYKDLFYLFRLLGPSIHYFFPRAISLGVDAAVAVCYRYTVRSCSAWLAGTQGTEGSWRSLSSCLSHAYVLIMSLLTTWWLYNVWSVVNFHLVTQHRLFPP